MKTSNLIRILLVILVFLWVSLKGQKMPEIIPFKLVPLNYEDNRKIELGIELIYPQKIFIVTLLFFNKPIYSS